MKTKGLAQVLIYILVDTIWHSFLFVLCFVLCFMLNVAFFPQNKETDLYSDIKENFKFRRPGNERS